MIDFSLIVNPLFHIPFLTGLLLAPTAALLGAYLRLREEWLAALSFAQVAAAGGVLSVLLPVPVIPAALGAAGLAALGKGALQRAGNDHYAVLILLGWSGTLLVAANSPHGEMVGKALVDGQLYFTGVEHLIAAVLLMVIIVAALPRLSPRLLLARLFPDHFSANGISGWRYHFAFDLLVVAAVAVTVTAMGVMAAFALVFLPAWVAFRLASCWRSVLMMIPALAVGSYLLAFILAILFNQPFGPVLTACLAALIPLRYLRPGRRPVNNGNGSIS